MRLFLPLLLIIAAIGLFALYTNPAYQGTKGIAAQVASYDDALSKSQELKAVRDQLISKRNTFAPSDVAKLQEVLPDNVDNIRLIIDINNIAARHQISLKNVSLGTVSDSRTAPVALQSGSTGDAVGSVDIGFTISASYDTMIAFVQDLEHSLRVIDIEKLDFSAPAAGGNTDYNFSIRTYWLH